MQWTEHVQSAVHTPLDAHTPSTAQPQLAPETPATAPRKRMVPLVWGIIAAGAVAVLAAAIILTVVLLQPADSPTNADIATAEPQPSTDPAPSTEPSPTADPTEDPGSGVGDALVEREEFMRTQKQPTDGSLLVAKTPEQRDFIAEAKQYVESNGGVWDAQTESYALALTLDACETSILNGHAVDEMTVRTHATTSPLLAALTQGAPEEQRAALTSGLMNLAVTGIGHVCPADVDQWQSAVDAIGSSW